MHAKSSQKDSPPVDALTFKMHSSQKEPNKVASFSAGENKPSDFLRVFYGCPGWRKNYFEGSLFWIGWKPCWASAIFVGVYEPTKQKLLKSFPENLSAVAHLTAGAIGGAASSLVRVPTEVIKQRLQTGQFASAPDAVRLIVAKEGFKGLYVGYGSFLLRDLPFDAIQFCIYEQIRIGYRLAARRDLNDPENAIIGAFAGAITGAITTPLDVIKTRLMVQGSANQYEGICDCVRTIVKEEGTHALLKGIGPRVLWIGIGGSIFFGVLERTKQILAQKRPPSRNSIPFKDQL
ncbi:putative s-adenosylmethionine carrier 2 [Quercus suber]|uniref:S-adenosylmethionine carrier 2 n=1 Tax=Quercus suber TaxID=58331 RepID=A0AAW0LLH1_QUESU